MSHLRDSTVAGPTVRRDNALASKCEYPLLNVPSILQSPIRPPHGTQDDYTAHLAIYTFYGAGGGGGRLRRCGPYTHQKRSFGASRFVSPGLVACLAAAHR